jgi:hypothetical protein
MATFCCCGNQRNEKPEGFKVNTSPCHCTLPAGVRRKLAAGLPWHVFEQQYNERKRLGLPILTDIEKGARSRWI